MSVSRSLLYLAWSYIFGMVAGSLLAAPAISYVGDALLAPGSGPVAPFLMGALSISFFWFQVACNRSLLWLGGAFLIASMAACIVAGHAGSAILLPVAYVAVLVPIILGGAILALPLLVIAASMLLCFRRGIERNLLAWCLSVPFTVAAAWVALEWIVVWDSRPNASIVGLAQNMGVWVRIVLAFACAALAARKFYGLVRAE